MRIRAVVMLLMAVGFSTVLFLQLKHKKLQKSMFTLPLLAVYDGSKGRGLYLSIMGEVFDVTPGSRFYGEGNGYHHFVGRDATRAFMTGEFEKDLTDDIKDFDIDQCASVVHWRNFFRNHTEYKFKGKLVGAFYDAAGQPLPEIARVENLAAQAKSAEEKMREAESRYPRCNSRWNQASGGFVWCDDGLYPRKLTTQIGNGKPSVRCACFKELGWSDVRQVYPGCDAQATECHTVPPGPSPGLTGRPSPGQEPAAAEATPAEDAPDAHASHGSPEYTDGVFEETYDPVYDAQEGAAHEDAHDAHDAHDAQEGAQEGAHEGDARDTHDAADTDPAAPDASHVPDHDSGKDEL